MFKLMHRVCNKRLAAVGLVLCCLMAQAVANEVTLFNQRGEPVAYIDTYDEYTGYL